MNPIIASALFGLVKGALTRSHAAPAPLGDLKAHSQLHLLGPVREELTYRVLPHFLGMPSNASTVAFAADHVLGERSWEKGFMPMATRFADTFAGGLLYDRAFRQWGALGAIAAHVLHNVMCDLGSRASSRLRR